MAKRTIGEKIHDTGGRTNNKAEKNVKHWLKDHYPGDVKNSYGLDEQEGVWKDAAARVHYEASYLQLQMKQRLQSPALIASIDLLNGTQARDNKRVYKISRG